MHELAFAAAAAGRHVELRGWVDRIAFDRLASATGVSPSLPVEPRRPDAQDIVVLPEGQRDPFAFATPLLSEARFVLMAMAPLGMLGWPFVAGWCPPVPLTVSAEEVNRPEYFRTIAAMDICLWTNSDVLAQLAAGHGIHTADVGEGSPIPFPEPAPNRSVDVVWLKDNRWAPAAGDLANRLSASVEAIDTADNAEILARFGRAKVLLYPAGVEGESRIAREARAMGCVPVLPRGNPLAVHIEAADGVLAVATPERIPEAIEELLTDPEMLATLSARGISSVRSEVAWTPFVERVSESIDALPPSDRTAGARGAIGDGIDGRLERVVELETNLSHSRHRNGELEAELERVNARRHEFEKALVELRNRRSVRWALAAGKTLRRED